jgi:hypothetical protein
MNDGMMLNRAISDKRLTGIFSHLVRRSPMNPHRLTNATIAPELAMA